MAPGERAAPILRRHAHRRSSGRPASSAASSCRVLPAADDGRARARRASTSATRRASPRASPRCAPDVVVNAAADNRVDAAEADPRDAVAVNAVAVAHARARAAATRGALPRPREHRLRLRRPRHAAPTPRTTPPNPLGAYARSKLAGELLARALAPRHAIVRVAGLYAAGGSRGKGGSFVDRVLAQARAGEPLRVVDDQVTAPTWARDVADRAGAPPAAAGRRRRAGGRLPRDQRGRVLVVRVRAGGARARGGPRGGRADQHGGAGRPAPRPAYSSSRTRGSRRSARRRCGRGATRWRRISESRPGDARGRASPTPARPRAATSRSAASAAARGAAAARAGRSPAPGNPAPPRRRSTTRVQPPAGHAERR